MTQIDGETELHSKNSSRPCTFRVDLLLDAVDVNTLNHWPDSFVKSDNMQGSAYLLIDPHPVNVYLSFHRSILAYICHNSAKTPVKAMVLPNECLVLLQSENSSARRVLNGIPILANQRTLFV